MIISEPDGDEQTKEIKNGLYESFHENGQLHLRENYKDGKEEGLWEEFYESGQLNQRENYKDGELDGPWEWFYENGELMTRATFINGKKEGLLESFHSNGQLQMTENYKDNELEGLVEEFDENGELSIRENYKDGVLQDEDDEQTDDTSKDKKLDLSNLDIEMWWEALDNFTMEEIQEFESQSTRYLGMARLLLIDLEDLKNNNTDRIRFKKETPFNKIELLEPWIGNEIKRFNGEYEKIDNKRHLSLHRFMNPNMMLIILFASTEEGYNFVTTLELEKDVIFENLKTECDECLNEITFSDSVQKDDDEWVRLCSICSQDRGDGQSGP